MKIGIYVDGLGQSVAQESVVKYATRLTNEYRFHNTGVEYANKVEKIKYSGSCESNVVSILERKGEVETVVYKLYEFKYGEILTGEFSKRNVLSKNLTLFGLVVKKFPLLIKRIFVSNGYYRPFQTFYIFLIFLLIAAAILFMIPATIMLISGFIAESSVVEFVHGQPWLYNSAKSLGINRDNLKDFSEIFVSIIAIILLMVPQANTIIISLATEFVCAHLYLELGKQKQDILGNMDLLVEYIAEHENDSKIHFHAYSFGSLIAIDYLFAYGKKPSGNILERTEALITIGTPFDMINSYYPNYYFNRTRILEEKLCWINVYSISDALASNFRFNSEIGESEYGINKNGLKPYNVNYEVVHVSQYNLLNFISLMSVKVHGMYWSTNTDGNSCLNAIYDEMKKRNLITG